MAFTRKDNWMLDIIEAFLIRPITRKTPSSSMKRSSRYNELVFFMEELRLLVDSLLVSSLLTPKDFRILISSEKASS